MICTFIRSTWYLIANEKVRTEKFVSIRRNTECLYKILFRAFLPMRTCQLPASLKLRHVTRWTPRHHQRLGRWRSSPPSCRSGRRCPERARSVWWCQSCFSTELSVIIRRTNGMLYDLKIDPRAFNIYWYNKRLQGYNYLYTIHHDSTSDSFVFSSSTLQ